MRKVTQQTVRAFLNGEKKSVGNTTTDGVSLWLHGNLIARKIIDGTIAIFDAGWRSNTTKERLNGIIEMCGCDPRMGIYQRKFQWYWMQGEEWTGRGVVPFKVVP